MERGSPETIAQLKKCRATDFRGYSCSIDKHWSKTMMLSPSSSRISRMSAAFNVSPASTLPPGNSQRPGRCAVSRRRVIRIFPSRQMTAATTVIMEVMQPFDTDEIRADNYFDEGNPSAFDIPSLQCEEAMPDSCMNHELCVDQGQ